VATSATGATSPGLRPPRPPGRVGSEEFHSGSLPTAQEAAVLFSANHVAAAIELLRAEIKDPVGRNNKQAWLLLFDLYQSQSNREEFDQLSMLYTVKFEQSAPSWAAGSEDSPSDPRRNQSRERKDFFALKPDPIAGLSAEIEKFRAFAEAQGTVRLDTSKITAITAEEATLLAGVLVQLRKKHLPMWFNNLETLEKVLRTAFNEAAGQKAFWLLLFELMILQGRAEEFEELALEYAVTFEMSPPIWETYVNTVAAAVAKSAPQPAASKADPEGFELKGVISAASANQFAELNAYAATRAEVAVDMSKVLRIEFNHAAAFFDVVKVIQLAGKRVILANLSELSAALLEAMGVNRYAILVRRKSS
jgi:anti-anti-sigma regulatory factor